MNVIFVGMARFELATSWSQTRRDNRATLHPELWLSIFKSFFYREWQDLNLQPSRPKAGRDNRATLHPELKNIAGLLG